VAPVLGIFFTVLRAWTKTRSRGEQAGNISIRQPAAGYVEPLPTESDILGRFLADGQMKSSAAPLSRRIRYHRFFR